jgi:hypothetical protein
MWQSPCFITPPVVMGSCVRRDDTCGWRVSRFKFQTATTRSVFRPSLRDNGSRGCAPDDRLREAIHFAAQRRNGLLRRSAPLRKRFAFVAGNDVGHKSAISPRDAPEFVQPSFAPYSEGAGNAGRPKRPQPRVQSVESTRVSHHGHAGTPGIPCAMVLTVSFVLSPVTGLDCHRRRRSLLRRLERQRRGVRTTRLRRPPQAHSSARHQRPPHPAPRS